MAIDKLKTSSLEDNSVTSPKLAPGAVTEDDIGDSSLPLSKISQVNLDIAPEVLEIQVSAPQAGQDTQWLWTWEQSTLPYARRTITNSPEISVPLYKQGTYTVNNYAAYDIFDQMTQTHSLYLKWIDGAGTDNLVSWATSTGPVSDTHPDINGGAATDVQRINVNVPATITLPTLTAPSVSYTVVNNGAGAYTFSGSASGDNPNLGPFYRGGTYTINITATGHPFYFTTDNGTNFSSGTYFGEYTSGVTGSRTDNGTITFTVPNDAPDTLYYQCGNHGVMRGAITVKDLAVETNINGNYVVYFQHTQEGHKTPVELRPIPSLVNQMCLVYDASTDKFVPQDLATYVENTPSFENKIREVAGTAELVVEDGSAVVAKVNVYQDSTYLPLVGNNAGDQAFATDTNMLYIWDGSAWQLAGAASTDELSEGTTNLYYTDARVASYLSSNDFDTATNIIASITDSAPATLDTLNELAAALGDDPNFATTVTNSLADKLPLSGGTLTGPLEVQGNGNATLEWGDTTAIGALSFDTGDNPLIRSYTGKDLLFQTNGNSNRMVIESDGNVGIGDDTPQAKLEVRNNTDATDTILATANLTTAGNYHNLLLGDGTAYAVGLRRHITVSNPSWLRPRLDFVVQGTDTYLPAGREVRMSITHNGKVGIGTTNPATKFHVKSEGAGNSNGTFYLGIDTPTNYPAMVLQTSTGGNYSETHGLYIKNTAAGFGLRIDDASGDTSPFVVDTEGRVGIGTASPSAKLDVRGQGLFHGSTGSHVGTSVGTITINSNVADNTYAFSQGLVFTNNTSGAGPWTHAAITTEGSTGYRGDLVFGTDGDGINNTTGITEKMRIMHNGNVGIGTSSPNAMLHVESVIGEHGGTGNTPDFPVIIAQNDLDNTINQTSGSGVGILFKNATNSVAATGAAIASIKQTGDDDNTSAELAFYVSDNDNVLDEVVRIDSSGNVGIGTASPNRKLEVVSDIDGSPLRIQGNSTVTQMEFAVSGGSVEAGIASSANELAFRVGSSSSSAEKMRMTTAGYYYFNSTGAHGPGGMVNITNGGTNNVTANALNVRSDTVNYALTLTNTVNGDCIWFSDNGTNGRGSINVTSSGTTYNTTSDIRLKDNISTIKSGKDIVLAMNPVTHTWKEDPSAGTVHGFIAQEMNDLIPEAVSGDPESEAMMSMDYGRITPVIVAALQDALKEIEELKTRIQDLENQ